MRQAPDFRHFVAFVAVAEELGFANAAIPLHITQSAVSTTIMQLEDWHGEQLFKRVSHGAELTDAGRKFLVWARKILAMRADSARATSRKHAVVPWPFRFGFSLFVNHQLIREAIKGHREIVPERSLQSISDCTAGLLEKLTDGRLDAAIVTLPVPGADLTMNRICSERLLICLPGSDPFANRTEIPKAAVAERLRILFNRECHPAFHDYILRKFDKAGMSLKPTHSYLAPSEMQLLVGTSNCFGLVREGAPIAPDLTARPIEGFELRASTALAYNAEEQDTPILSMLAQRMAELCPGTPRLRKKKPVGSANGPKKPEVRRAG